MHSYSATSPIAINERVFLPALLVRAHTTTTKHLLHFVHLPKRLLVLLSEGVYIAKSKHFLRPNIFFSPTLTPYLYAVRSAAQSGGREINECNEIIVMDI